MTANHAHTPLDTAWIRNRIAESYAVPEVGAKAFDRWLDARDDKLIAAAEQRGAERERKDIAASLIDWDVMYGHEPADEETRIQHEIANWIETRADRIANKEEDDA